MTDRETHEMIAKRIVAPYLAKMEDKDDDSLDFHVYVCLRCGLENRVKHFGDLKLAECSVCGMLDEKTYNMIKQRMSAPKRANRNTEELKFICKMCTMMNTVRDFKDRRQAYCKSCSVAD